jgi:DNA polymerase-4
LPASVGVATNKFLAKLASDLRKPDALVVLEPENVRSVLDPLPVGKLWGVGGKSEKRLNSLGIRTVGQLAALPEQILVDHWGESGRHLWQLARGLDSREVIPDSEARSISTETTFARDIGRRDLLRAWLFDLVEELGERMRRARIRGRTVELKVRSSDFRTFNRSQTLAESTDLTAQIWQSALELFERRVSDEWLPLRLIGVGATNLMREGPVQGHLFEDGWRRKQRSVDQVVDEIKRQFGGDSIRRAGGVGDGGAAK